MEFEKFSNMQTVKFLQTNFKWKPETSVQFILRFKKDIMLETAIITELKDHKIYNDKYPELKKLLDTGTLAKEMDEIYSESYQ